MSVIYLGPDLKRIVRKNQIFTYQPDTVIKKACEVNKLAKYMFIDMEKVTEARKELNREGSFLNITYNKIRGGKN